MVNLSNGKASVLPEKRKSSGMENVGPLKRSKLLKTMKKLKVMSRSNLEELVLVKMVEVITANTKLGELARNMNILEKQANES